MVISYDAGKYFLIVGLLAAIFGAWRVLTNESGETDIAGMLAIVFGGPLIIAGLLLSMIARQRRN